MVVRSRRIIWRHYITVRIKMRSVLRAAFGKYLLATNTASSGVLMLLGDFVEQEFKHKKSLNDGASRYDYRRLARMFIVGLTMGPVHHYYYNYINKLWPARQFMSVSKKILADQLGMSPICIAQFFYILGALEKKSLKDTTEELSRKFGTIYAFDWCVWPPVQCLNFYLVPVKYQVTYINAMTMLYNVFLSYIKYDFNIATH